MKTNLFDEVDKIAYEAQSFGNPEGNDKLQTLRHSVLPKIRSEHAALLSAAAAAEQALEALRLVWDDKSARFSTVHKGLPLSTVLRNAISATALSLSELDELHAKNK